MCLQTAFVGCANGSIIVFSLGVKDAAGLSVLTTFKGHKGTRQFFVAQSPSSHVYIQGKWVA